jgi:hypothetical protein
MRYLAMRRLAIAGLITALLLVGRNAAGTVLAVTYAPGWNLVAGPAGSTFPGATAVYSFPPGAEDYIARTGATPSSTGYGYWAYYPHGGSPNFADNPSNCRTMITAPVGQYFLAGNSSSTNAATVSGASAVYTFDPVAHTYVAATSLVPGQGAWVMPDSGGVVTIVAGNCTPASAAAAPAPQPIVTVPT